MLSPDGQTFLRLLVNKYFPGRLDQLAKIAPKEDYEALSAIALSEKNPEALLFNPEEWLVSMHASWLEPLFSKMPQPLKELYFANLPPTVIDYLRTKDEHKETIAATITLSEPVRLFLSSYLHRHWTESKAKPKDHIPENELSALLHMTRKELLELADLLAIYDIVDEVRHIVDKRVLQSLVQYLTPIQQQYLRICLRQKTKAFATGSTLRELLKEGPKFASQLHRKGLQRLGTALSGSDSDFLWHIMHTFDMQRAKFIAQYLQLEVVPTTTQLVRQQVQQILQFLKIDKGS